MIINSKNLFEEEKSMKTLQIVAIFFCVALSACSTGKGFQELVEKSSFQEAALYYNQNRDYFIEKSKSGEYNNEIKRVVSVLNSEYSKKSNFLQNKIQSDLRKSPLNQSEWGRAKNDIEEANNFIADYERLSPMIKEKKKKNQEIVNLNRDVMEIERLYSTKAEKAFLKFKHTEGNFFDQYPVNVDKSIFQNNYKEITKKITTESQKKAFWHNYNSLLSPDQQLTLIKGTFDKVIKRVGSNKKQLTYFEIDDIQTELGREGILIKLNSYYNELDFNSNTFQKDIRTCLAESQNKYSLIVIKKITSLKNEGKPFSALQAEDNWIKNPNYLQKSFEFQNIEKSHEEAWKNLEAIEQRMLTIQNDPYLSRQEKYARFTYDDKPKHEELRERLYQIEERKQEAKRELDTIPQQINQPIEKPIILTPITYRKDIEIYRIVFDNLSKRFHLYTENFPPQEKTFNVVSSGKIVDGYDTNEDVKNWIQKAVDPKKPLNSNVKKGLTLEQAFQFFDKNS